MALQGELLSRSCPQVLSAFDPDHMGKRACSFLLFFSMFHVSQYEFVKAKLFLPKQFKFLRSYQEGSMTGG